MVLLDAEEWKSLREGVIAAFNAELFRQYEEFPSLKGDSLRNWTLFDLGWLGDLLLEFLRIEDLRFVKVCPKLSLVSSC